MERYFVSYSFKDGDGFGFGNTETVSNRKITDSDVIKSIARSIERDYSLESYSVVILSFQRFDK